MEPTGDQPTLSFLERRLCVLVFELTSTEELKIRYGDAQAKDSVHQSLIIARHLITENEGSINKTVGEEVVGIFPSPLSAIKAGSEIQRRLSQHSIGKPDFAQARIGLHFGQVFWKKNDVYGDAVVIASLVAKHANAGQLFTTIDTLEALDPDQSSLITYPVGPRNIGDRADMLYELVWDSESQIETQITAGILVPEQARSSAIRFFFGRNNYTWQHTEEPFRIGRDRTCTIVLTRELASRNHARFEARGDQIYLVDASRNGTYVTFSGQTEFKLHNLEIHIPPSSSGILSFGTSKASTLNDLLSFSLN